MKNILEIACFNLNSAIIAESSGADRIELCENYPAGGITPCEELILETRKKIRIPIHVIIRPRSGNFIYSDSEIEEMKKSILLCKLNKIDGIVFGILTKENKINVPVCKQLLEIVKPLPVTFHRAVDSCENILSAFETLIELGFNSVLSSGGASDAMKGLKTLKDLQKQFGQKITIIPAGNIRSSNIQEIIKSGCYEFHSSAIISRDSTADENEIKKLRSGLIS